VKLSLYDTLEVSPDAPADSIRASLRRLVKRLYRNTRDIGGDTEEGLRFANVTASILLTERVRRDYNNSIKRGVDTVGYKTLSGLQMESRRRENMSTDANLEDTQEGSASAIGEINTSFIEQSLNTLTLLRSNPCLVNGLSLIAIFLSVLLTVGIISLGYADPNWVERAKAAIIVMVILLVVTGLALLLSRNSSGSTVVYSAGLSDLPIIKWRRERAIFIGDAPIEEDQSWIYRLRVAEVNRSKQLRVSQVNPLRRILARLIDYGLLGLLLFALITLIGQSIPPILWLTTWWCLPCLTVLLFIPIEALCFARYGMTLGMRLSCIVPLLGLTQLYGKQPITPRLNKLAWLRASHVAWRGFGLGLPIVCLIAGLLQIKKLSFNHETSWDAKSDCLLTQVPMDVLHKAAVILLSLALMVSYVHIWRPSVQQSVTGLYSLTHMTASQLNTAVSEFKFTDMKLPSIGLSMPKPEAVKSDTRPLAADPKVFQFENLEEKRRRWGSWEKQVRTAFAEQRIGGMVATCEKWAGEDFSNPLPLKCWGLALQANGSHERAIAILRKAQVLDNGDRTLEDAITRSYNAKRQQ
jgi:hypothetical protein